MTIAGVLLKKISEDQETIWHAQRHDLVDPYNPEAGNDINADDPDGTGGGLHSTASGGLDFRAKGPVILPPGSNIWDLTPEDVEQGGEVAAPELATTMNNFGNRGAMTQSVVAPDAALMGIEEANYQLGLKIGMNGLDFKRTSEDTTTTDNK